MAMLCSTLLGSKTQTIFSVVAAHILVAMLQRQACLPCVLSNGSNGSCVTVEHAAHYALKTLP